LTPDSLDQALGPADNRMTVVPGLLGTCPNAIYRVHLQDPSALEAAPLEAGLLDCHRLENR
jgi:hypothetical protein